LLDLNQILGEKILSIYCILIFLQDYEMSECNDVLRDNIEVDRYILLISTSTERNMKAHGVITIIY
jgi:hypothetical protein